MVGGIRVDTYYWILDDFFFLKKSGYFKKFKSININILISHDRKFYYVTLTMWHSRYLVDGH